MSENVINFLLFRHLSSFFCLLLFSIDITIYTNQLLEILKLFIGTLVIVFPNTYKCLKG